MYESAGVDGTSLRAIVAEYGCSSMMPCKYFDSKADLIDGLRVRSYEWLRGVLVAAASEADQPVAALGLLAKAYVRAALDRPRGRRMRVGGDRLSVAAGQEPDATRGWRGCPGRAGAQGLIAVDHRRHRCGVVVRARRRAGERYTAGWLRAQASASAA